MTTKTTKVYDLKEKFEAFFPKVLDEVIRRNREHCQVGHATETDLKPLLGEVPVAYPKLVITNWHLVTIQISTGEQKTVLLGDIADGSGNTWITSKIVQLDPDSGYLLTSSGSLYLMAEKGEGEPSFEQLALFCTYLNKGDAGELFGVPRFFLG